MASPSTSWIDTATKTHQEPVQALGLGIDDEETTDHESAGQFLEPDDVRIQIPPIEPRSSWLTPESSSPGHTSHLRADGDPDEEEATPPQSTPLRATSQIPPATQAPYTDDKPTRHVNRRLLLATVAVIAVIGIIIFGSSSKQKPKPGDPGQSARSARELDGAPPRQFSAGGEGTLGSPALPYQQAAPPPQAAPSPQPSPTVQATPPPPVEARDDDDFGLTLTEGDRAEKLAAKQEDQADQRALREGTVPTAAQASTTKEQPSPVPKGTKMQMRLVDPVRSGVATTVRAEVLQDVQDANGKVVLPKDSTTGIPFLAYEVNGRLLSDARQPISFVTPSGETVTLPKATVKGPDGFSGITGKVTRVGGRSTAGRALGAVANTAVRLAGREAANYSPDASSEIYQESYQYNNPYFDRSSRIVEVQANTKFLLVAGW
jgi:hypothetical protein